MLLAVCWKWLSLDGEIDTDKRWAGVSPADEAALEVALTIADSVDDTSDVVVLCLGPEAAESTLREAIAAGAHKAIRIDASPDLDSRTVASALAAQLHGVDLVVCGDHSLDRGTGSVPAFLAAELEAAQALGLVQVEAMSLSADRSRSDSSLRVVRRLDGGRREVLDVPNPAVISVEGSVAKLRRSSLAASLAAKSTAVTVVPGPSGEPLNTEVHPLVQPFRPRPRMIAPPSGNALTRVRDLLDIAGTESHAETVTLEPPDAATRIVDQLHEWGYLDADLSPKGT